MTVQDIKKLKWWINYKLKQNEKGKTTKVPLAYDGTSVGTTKEYSEKWCNYETAQVQVKNGTADGTGIVLKKLLPNEEGEEFALTAIDIDNRDFEDVITKDIINIMKTYTEISPSQNGFHLLCFVNIRRLPPNYKEEFYMKNPHNKVEAYIGGLTNRFITFTQNVVLDEEIDDRTEQFLQFLEKYMKRDIEDNNTEKDNTVTTCIEDNSVPQSNNFIIDMILKTKQADKFNKLFFLGDISDYNEDHSSADLALTTILAFYVGPDIERIDKLMRQSKLYRSKWERTDYREMTIKKAIQNCNGKFFNWNQEELQEESKDYSITINSFTANEIMQLDLKPLEPVIKNLLYPGFSILAGAPKVGKSWQCMDIALSVCNGNNFLGFETNKSGVLYLALEDSLNRIKDRMKKVLGENSTAPNNLHVATSCNPLDEGFLTELQNTINENPDIKLIIIDTLQKIRGAQVKGETWYASDYKEVAKLKKFADFNKVCILAIHHLRKQKDSDPFNQISGSSGITGAADTMIVLSKIDNGNGEVMMSVTGRDVDYIETVIKFNKETFKWEIVSQTSDYEDYRKQLDYKNNPVVSTLKILLAKEPYKTEGLRLTASELLERTKDLTGIVPRQKSPQVLSRELNEHLQYDLWDFDKIYYESGNVKGGKNGRELYFYKKEMPSKYKFETQLEEDIITNNNEDDDTM